MRWIFYFYFKSFMFTRLLCDFLFYFFWSTHFLALFLIKSLALSTSPPLSVSNFFSHLPSQQQCQKVMQGSWIAWG